MTLLLGGIVVATVALAIGWLAGYSKACRVHGWYLPETLGPHRSA